MSRYWSEKVNQLTPYTPGEQPQDVSKWIKLNTNENPYAPSPKVFAAIEQSTKKLQYYPSSNSSELKSTLAQYHNVDETMVFIGNGSDEVLAHTFQALLKHEKPLLTVDISYSFYAVYANLYDISLNEVPLLDDLSVDVNAICEKKGEVGGFIIANPNAPTSLELSKKEIERIIRAHRDIPVVIDEAYIDFGNESCLDLVSKYDNLLVIRTMSKSRALAGLRIGYAIGHRQCIEALYRVKDSFNSYPVNCVSEAAAVASLRDEDYFQVMKQKILSTRTDATETLTALGFTVINSATNFLFAEHSQIPASEIYQQLYDARILVRYFPKKRLSNYLRITIGTDIEMAQLFQSLEAIIKNRKNTLK